MSQKRFSRKASSNSAGGFTLLEVMISIVVMTVALLAVVASFGAAIAVTASAEEDLIARQKALEAMESIYAARNSQQIPFSSVANISNGGIFLSGSQSMLCPGPDGLVGTADDVACTTASGLPCPNGGAECMVLPGPDGVLGTSDDVTMSLANFQRTTTISKVLESNGSTNPNMVSIAITVSYTKPGLPARSFTANGLISSYH